MKVSEWCFIVHGSVIECLTMSNKKCASNICLMLSMLGKISAGEIFFLFFQENKV